MNTLYRIGDIVKKWEVIFYIDGKEVEGGDLLIQAMDYEWAEQVLYLMLNTGEGIPSIYDYYTKPKLVESNV